MADYSKNQDKSQAIFAQTMQTFTQRVETVFNSLNEIIMNTGTAINASLQDIAKNLNASNSGGAETSSISPGVSDTLDLIAGGIADIVSFLYEKQYTVQQLGTVGSTIDSFLSEKNGATTGPAAGQSSEAKVIDSASGAISNLLTVLSTFTVADYQEDIIALKNLFISLNEAFDVISSNPSEQLKRAVIGKDAVVRIGDFFDAFSTAFNIKRLTNISGAISRLNVSQVGKLSEFWLSISQILSIAGDTNILNLIDNSQKSIDAIIPLIVKLSTDFVPAIIDFNNKSKDTGNAAESINNVSAIFKDMAELGKSSVIITISAPFIISAIWITKKLFNSVTDVGVIINTNANIIAESQKNITPYKNVILGIIGIALSIIALGFIASYVTGLKQGVIIIITSVACMLGIVTAIALLQAAISAIGGDKMLLKPLGSIKSLINAIIVTVGTLVVLGLLAPIIAPLINRGIDIIVDVFTKTILMGIIVGLVLKALGGENFVIAPLRSIINIIIASLITIVVIVVVSTFVKNRLPELLDGILLVTGSLLLTALSFRLAANGIMGSNPQSSKNAIKMLIGLMVFSVINIILMIVIAKKLTWQEILKALVVPASMILIALSFRLVGEVIKKVATPETIKTIWTLIALTVISAAVIYLMGTFIKLEHILGITIFFGALLGITLMFKLVYKELSTIPWMSFIKTMGMLFGATLAGALVIWWAGNLGNNISVAGLAILCGCMMGLAVLLKVLDHLNKDKSITNGAKVLGIISLAIFVNALALGTLALVANLYESVDVKSIVIMAGIVVGFGAIVAALGSPKISQYAERGAIVLGILSIAIGINAVALGLMGVTAMLFNNVKASSIVKMSAIIIGFALIVVALGEPQISTYVAIGSAVLAILSAAILLNTIALGMFAIVTFLYENVNIKNVAKMTAVIVGYGLLIAALGVPAISVFAAIGAAVLAIISAAILLNVTALATFALVTFLYEDVNIENVAKMTAVIVGFGLLAAALGVPPISIFAATGAVVLTILSIAIMSNALALGTFALVTFLYEDVKVKNMKKMADVVIGFALLTAALGVPPISIFAGIGSAILAILSASILVNSLALLAFASITFIYEKVKLENMKKMAAVVLAFAGMVAILGAPPFLVLVPLGCAVLAIVAATMLVNSVGLTTLAVTSMLFTDKTIVAIRKMKTVIMDTIDLLVKMALMSPAIAIASGTAFLLLAAVSPLSAAIVAISVACSLVTNGVVAGVGRIRPVINKFIHSLDGIDYKAVFHIMWLGPALAAAMIPLGTAIALLATSIAYVASLRIPIYTGTKITGYRELKESDFTKASRNISRLVTVLGKTIIDLYYGRSAGVTPEMAKQMFASNWRGDTPFALVSKSVANLGNMIKEIASGVAAYASLQIPIYEGTKITSYRELSSGDFKAASRNISLIVTVLGITLMRLYRIYPWMFSKSYKSDTPFAIVSDSVSRMGNMISEIAKGVKNFAAGTFQKYENGELVGTFNMDASMYVMAAWNISYVVTVIGISLMRVYQAFPEFFKTSWSNKTSPINQVIDSVNRMSTMISLVADCVKKVANSTFQRYDRNGKLIGTFNIGPAQYRAVGSNIRMMFASLIPPLLIARYMYPQIFGDDKFMATFENSVRSMNNIISNTAGTLVNIASLKIPIYKGKDIVGYHSVGKRDFSMAASNVKLILTSLLKTLSNLYTDPETSVLFKTVVDANGKVLSDTVLGRVMNAITPITKFLSDLAKGVTDLAQARYPRYNSKGKIVGYDKITSSDYVKMGINIRTLVSSMMKTLVGLYQDPELKSIFSDEGDSILKTIISRINPVIDFIVKIAESVLKIASGSYEVSIGKKGKTKKVRLTSEDYKKAAENTSTVITLLVNTLMSLATNPAYSAVWKDEANSPINQVMNVVKRLKDIIGIVVDSIVKMASSQYSYVNSQGKEVKINITNLNISDFANSLKEMIIQPVKTFIDINNLPEFNSFVDGTVPERFKIAASSFSGTMSSLKSIATALDKRKDIHFTMAPIDAYNEFIKQFRIETLDDDIESRIDATKGLVKSINTLDIRKAGTLVSLLRELNLLSARLGGLDNFTKTLCEILTIQLNRLNKQLKESAKTIYHADKVRYERESSIARILNEVNDMLNKPINVQPIPPEDYDMDSIDVPSSGITDDADSPATSPDNNTNIGSAPEGMSFESGEYMHNNMNHTENFRMLTKFLEAIKHNSNLGSNSPYNKPGYSNITLS